MMPPPAKCDEALRRQAASVAVKNNAFPSTTYLVSVRELSCVIFSGYLHDGKQLAVRGAIMLPMQWPRHLDQICFPAFIVQIELLRVGKRNCSCLATHLTAELHTREIAFVKSENCSECDDGENVANGEVVPCCPGIIPEADAALRKYPPTHSKNRIHIW